MAVKHKNKKKKTAWLALLYIVVFCASIGILGISYMHNRSAGKEYAETIQKLIEEEKSENTQEQFRKMDDILEEDSEKLIDENQEKESKEKDNK